MKNSQEITNHLRSILDEHARDYLLIVEDHDRGISLVRSDDVIGLGFAVHAETWLRSQMAERAAQRVRSEE